MTIEQTMVDVRSVISSLFITLREHTYVLIRIEILVALVTMMFMVMFIMDYFRCRSRGSTVTRVLKAIDGLSDQIVVYLLGAMQSAGFENPLFPVWAVVLVSLRASLGYLSGYGVPDHERRLTEVANVIKFLGVGFLNGTRGLDFAKPLWSLWAILVLRSIYRCFAHEMALRSLWHGRSSEFLPEYMRDRNHAGDPEQGKLLPSGEQVNGSAGGHVDNNLASNHGQHNNDGSQKYLVRGESNQNINLKRPGYTLHLEVVNESKLITLDKILGCSESLLISNNNNNNNNNNSHRYKDMSLAFTLSRLLRCRLEDVTLHKESILGAQHLITSNITDNQQPSTNAEEGAKQAFRILELELAFVRDYFYTLYPLVFWQGLGSLCFSLLESVATFAIAFWLGVGIRKVYHPPADALVLRVNGQNVDVIITWVFILFMMFKEVWEMVTYLLSKWTKLLLVCKYVQNKAWFMGSAVTANLTRSFFNNRIADPWHGCFDQYDFLQSCTYKASFWKLANFITFGKIPEKPDGKKRGEAIKIPEGVKSAILQALQRIGLKNPQLPGEIPSLTGEFQRYEWACLGLHTCSEVILVWHIATSICEIKLAQDLEKETNRGFLQSASSYLKNLCHCTSQPYLVQENICLHGEFKEIQANHRIANSLSRYCAYLQAFRPELLPDSFVVPDVIFNETLQDARGLLEDCNMARCRYGKLMATAPEVVQGSVDRRLSMKIVQQGATLAKELIEMEDTKSRWKILAGVWADLLVHIAPSWNAVDHKNNLESGGEFITLIWALLWHCGIEKSKLWDKDEESESNPQVHQENNTESSNIQSVEEQQASESNAQVPQENNTASSIQYMEEQQVSESSAQVPQENNTASNILCVEER